MKLRTKCAPGYDEVLPGIAMAETGVEMTNLFTSIKLAFKTKNIFCRILVILWIIYCAVMTLCFAVGSAGSVGAEDIIWILLLYFFGVSAFLIPAVSIAQGINAADNSYSDKSWELTLVLSAFLGFLGIHRFYVGKKATGVIYLFTAGGFMIGWFTDAILVLTGHFTDKNGNIISNIDSSKQKGKNGKGNTYERGMQKDSAKLRAGQQESQSKNISIFTEIVVPGSDEKSQSIPSRAAMQKLYKNTYAGSTAKSPSENSDAFGSGSSYYGYSSGSKFINDMQKYKDKTGREVPFVPFMHYWPTYDDMDRYQKAWYFYWRSEVRNGRYPDTDLSYIFVHIYEILSGCGWDSAENGYAQLIKLWDAYREQFSELDNYLFDWTYDFAQLHNLDYVVPQAADSCLPSQPVLRDILIDKHREDKPLKLTFPLVDALCDYSITGSKFYNDGNQILMNEAIPRVISLADAALLKKRGKGILELYGPNRTRKQSYYAFQGAICPYANKRVDTSVRAYTSSQRLRSYINQLVRYAENVLREIRGCRGRLRGIEIDPETAELVSAFLKKEYSPKKDVRSPQKKVEINLDPSAIETLRAESDAVRDALEVADDTASEPQLLTDPDEVSALINMLSANAKAFLYGLFENGWSAPATSDNKAQAEEINRAAVQYLARELLAVEDCCFIVEDDYRDEIEYIFKATPDIVNQHSEQIENIASASDSADTYFDITRLSEDLESVITAMTTVQQEALWAIVVLDDPQERLNALADEALTMPEILIDEINDIASQQLDDILIDTFNDTLCILEQYGQELKDAAITEGF